MHGEIKLNTRGSLGIHITLLQTTHHLGGGFYQTRDLVLRYKVGGSRYHSLRANMDLIRVTTGNMADTRIQIEVEDWVRRNWMPIHFGKKFFRERLKVRSGGVFDFDAVSDDASVVGTISTSGSKTSGMKNAVGKILKLRSDVLFLTMVKAERRVIVLTEQDMFDQCKKESAGGRVPPEIEFVCAEIPDELRARLVAARLKASGEHRAESRPDEVRGGLR